jgi:hypothetical protein
MRKIIEADAEDGFRVALRFDDGTRGVADLSDLAGRGVFAAWSGPSQFKSLAIGSAGELTWTCGVDLCADALYLRVTGKRPADLFPSLGAPETRCA